MLSNCDLRRMLYSHTHALLFAVSMWNRVTIIYVYDDVTVDAFLAKITAPVALQA